MSIVDSTSNALKESATKSVGDSASKAVTGAVSNSVSGAANTISSTASNAVSGASNAVSGVKNAVSGAVSKVLTNVAVGAAVGAVSGTVAKTLTKVAVGAVAGAAAGAVTGAVASVLSGSIAKLTESASATKFTLEIPGSGFNTSVADFSAHEEMSEPFVVNVKLACDDKVPFDKVLGSEALLKITTDSMEPRYFHGVISRFKRAGKQGKYLYEASILPYLALLSMSTDCRIFQNMTVVEIVKEVLNAYKHFLGTDRYKFLALKGNGDKVKRVYCVQYRETDLDFISRILAEEGIFYYFEHSKEKHVIVFGDNIMNYKEIPGTTTIAFNSSSGMNTGTDSIQSFDFSHQLTPGKVAHQSYNYENSSVKLKADKKEKTIFDFEVYDHSVHIQDEAGGSTFSKTHLESLKTFEAQAEADSVCPRLSTGYIFSMDKGKPDVQYLVTSITHIGVQPQVLEENAHDAKTTYSNIFISIPAKTTYRPGLISKPVITGLQSAVVVGAKGDEIHTDDYGRVKVQFHWDRLGKNDDKSSCWLRVAQTWGGGGGAGNSFPVSVTKC
jgi:type VI secretion system secreted protein VgrG